MTDGARSAAARAFTSEHADDVLATACDAVGLDHVGARLLRLGENAVYRLAGPVVVRIARSTVELPAHKRTVALARWLAAADYPAVRLLPGVPQPLAVSGHVATFWELVAHEERIASTAQFADLLRRLHTLPEPQPPHLPGHDPMAATWRRLRCLPNVATADAVFLRQRAAALSHQYDTVQFDLPTGPLHGDANVANALCDATGRAVLIDLDDMARGHPEWDLAVTALSHERYGWHSRAEYQAFVHTYGYDVLDWPGYPVIADMQELAMVVWLGQNVGHDDDARAEFARRVGDLRTGGDRHGWHPF